MPASSLGTEPWPEWSATVGLLRVAHLVNGTRNLKLDIKLDVANAVDGKCVLLRATEGRPNPDCGASACSSGCASGYTNWDNGAIRQPSNQRSCYHQPDQGSQAMSSLSRSLRRQYPVGCLAIGLPPAFVRGPSGRLYLGRSDSGRSILLATACSAARSGGRGWRMIRTSGHHRPRRGGRFVDVDEGEWA